MIKGVLLILGVITAIVSIVGLLERVIRPVLGSLGPVVL